MGKLAVAMVALCVNVAFGQLVVPKNFKENNYSMYEMAFKNVTEAIHSYNNVLDMNGVDVSNSVYDVTKNPIDFGFFPSGDDKVIVSFLVRYNGRYRLMFSEIPANENKYFFDVLSENGEFVKLVYKINE
jgi:hypothetical protein